MTENEAKPSDVTSENAEEKPPAQSEVRISLSFYLMLVKNSFNLGLSRKKNWRSWVLPVHDQMSIKSGNRVVEFSSEAHRVEGRGHQGDPLVSLCQVTNVSMVLQLSKKSAMFVAEETTTEQKAAQDGDSGARGSE